MSIRSLPQGFAVLVVVAHLLACVSLAEAQTSQLLLDPEAPIAWETVASDGVSISAEQVESDNGPMLRIEYSFETGAGFGIVRRPFTETLGDNYRFRYRVRGTGLANDLEFKLLDESGDNVWWVNRRAFVPPDDWATHTNRRRHFEFAWGPSGGEPIEQTSWIEFAIASHSGGSGELFVDQLAFEPLPPEVPYTGMPTVTDLLADRHTAIAVGPAGEVGLAPTTNDGLAQIEFDFGSERTLSALEFRWENAEPGDSFSYSVSPVGFGSEQTLGSVAASHGGRDLVWLGESDVSGLRINVESSPGAPPKLLAVTFLEPGDVSTTNDLLRRLAAASPTHAMPPAFHDVQTAWTVSGGPDHGREATVTTNGRVEFDKAGASIEPFMAYASGDLVGWDGAIHQQDLIDGHLPIPIVTRSDGLTELRVTVVSIGDTVRSSCLVEYAVTNTTDSHLDTSLILAVRPLQVLPHWQRLNVIGGFSPLQSIDASASRMLLNGQRPVYALTPADGAHVWDLQDGPLPPTRPQSAPGSMQIEHPHGFGAAAWRYQLSLAPGDTARVLVEAPYADAAGAFAAEPSTAPDAFDAVLSDARSAWTALVSRVPIRLPAHAAHLEDSIKSTIAYLLINRDGSKLQPGSRTYERSWIRDGAISSAALLAFGHDDAVKDYLDWYAGYTFANGKVPCVVDHRGPDPVDEHDSTGQLIFALARHARTTGDHSLLLKHADTVHSGVAYLESLIAQRSTEAYEGTAYFGLVPESISHEGYSAKPMHSYWDCFFVLQGLRDAAWIAGALGDTGEEQRREALADTFQTSLYESIRTATREQSIGYIPGCVELGDFDPTSTAVALAPLGIADALPQDLLETTLDLYTEFFESRHLGQREWFDYTPYELRVIGAMHTAGRHAEAHRMTDWFLSQQTPVGWNQWPEVVYADPKHPGFVGDIPHTWCATGLINSFVTGLIHPTADAIVIGSGIPDSWYLSPDGFSIDGLKTEFGALHLAARSIDGRLSITIELTGEQSLTDSILVALPTESIDPDQIRINGVAAARLVDIERAGRNYVRLPSAMMHGE